MKTDIKNVVSKLTKEEAEIVTRLLKDKAVIKKNRRMELVSVEAEVDDVTTNTGPCIGFETDEEADRWRHTVRQHVRKLRHHLVTVKAHDRGIDSQER